MSNQKEGKVMEDKWIEERVAKSFLIAYQGYKNALESFQGEEALSVAVKINVGQLSPMAAEVFRMLTQPVLVTVNDDVIVSRSDFGRLKASIEKLGYRGVINAGGIKMEFPTSEPIELNIEGIIE